MLPSPKVLPWAMSFWAYSPWGYQVIQPMVLLLKGICCATPLPFNERVCIFFFIKYSAFFLLDIQKLCTFALNYNYRRMSKLGTIIHPLLLGNKTQGCCVARRNLFFFDTLNVEHWEHSNNLLTHIRRTDRLSPYIFVHVCAREALRHIHLERVCHTVPLPFSHARFPTSTS